MPRTASTSDLECREQIRTWLTKHRLGHKDAICGAQCEQADVDLACKIVRIVRSARSADNADALMIQVRDAMYAASDAGQAGLPLRDYAATFTRFARAAVAVLMQQA